MFELIRFQYGHAFSVLEAAALQALVSDPVDFSTYQVGLVG